MPLIYLTLFAPAAVARSTAPITGPLRVSANPHYFQDANGNVLILSGSHTWNTVQDWGSNGSLEPLDFNAFVKFLQAHGHNFTLLWYTELPKFCGFPSTASMMAAAARREFDLVLFWSLDRFSREGVLETLQYLRTLTSYGVGWKSYTEQYLDSCGVFRDAVLSILATIAKQERVRLSERTLPAWSARGSKAA